MTKIITYAILCVAKRMVNTLPFLPLVVVFKEYLWLIKKEKAMRREFTEEEKCDFRKKDGRGMDLRRENFGMIDLRRFDFRGADLRGTKFRGTCLVRANFSGADCRGTDFTGADLSNVRFYGTDLRGADFTGAELRHADFTEAILPGIDLTEGKNIDLAIGLPS